MPNILGILPLPCTKGVPHSYSSSEPNKATHVIDHGVGSVWMMPLPTLFC
jgi:hypothetical protein